MSTKWILFAVTIGGLVALMTKKAKAAALPAKAGDLAPNQTRSDIENRTVSYTVKRGDSYATIAKAFYGTMQLWPFLFDTNRDIAGGNPDLIATGLVIKIPPKDAIDATKISCYMRRTTEHTAAWKATRAGSTPTLPASVTRSC